METKRSRDRDAVAQTPYPRWPTEELGVPVHARDRVEPSGGQAAGLTTSSSPPSVTAESERTL